MDSPGIDNLDVVVVGGGPGGSAAAISCAQAGLTVALLEQACFPRNRPGETLHPGVEPILEKLGVWDAVQEAGFSRHAGHYVEWFGERRFEAFGSDASGDWLGFQAWRADFDAILLNQARVAGVRVVQPCRALRPIADSNRVAGVETHQGLLKATFTIDATGSGRWLERHLQLGANYLTPRLIARYGYANGECPTRDEAPLIVADAEGWTWTARVRPNLYQWTKLALTEKSNEKSNEKLIAKDWLPSEFVGMKPVGSVKSADATWRIVRDTAGPGYFIVGDAAAVLDPASSHGILKALMSGMMAAHLIVKSIELGVKQASAVERVAGATQMEAHCIETYRKWLESWFSDDANRLKELYTPFLRASSWPVS
jgi:flavin-dependent dehydrogenase